MALTLFTTAVATIVLLAWPEKATAGGGAITPGNWPWMWKADPLVLLNLALLAWIYHRGYGHMASVGKHRGIGRPQAIAFAASLVVVAISLLSPLDALAEQLASAHMVQHMVLMLIAAPLFVFARPATVLSRGLPREVRRWLHAPLMLARWLLRPLTVWLLYAFIWWSWHHPLLYQAALRDELVHDAQHLTFFGAGVLFWQLLLDPRGQRLLSAPAAVLWLFMTSLQTSLLGIFLALAPNPWYADYFGRTLAWGLTALADQQLAGLIMWMPGCLIYLVVAACVLGDWLARSSPASVVGQRSMA